VPRILVIDDEPPVRALLQTVLERAGYDVVTAPDGNKGLRYFHDFPTDLIITDIVMPEKEGLETIRELRMDYPEVKIIAISGGGRIAPEPYLSMAERFGAVRSFAKPVKADVLLGAVEELIGSA
jgi:DNA-binding response OmpR family regulator